MTTAGTTTAGMTIAGMTIGGEVRHGSASFGVINPATGVVFAEAPLCSQRELDEAMAAAAMAFDKWRADDDERRVALRDAAQALYGAAAELGALLTAEQGRPSQLALMEVLGAGTWLQYYADLELPPTVLQDDGTVFAEVVRKPLGVVAAITPWNVPLILACWKLAPALRAGNTVVLKPSPFTPLATLRMGELLARVFPPGVLNVVSGDDDLGARMTHHATPRKVSFTGSIETGKRVASAAAADLKRVTLELGGNDAAIVLDDVDPAAVADKLFWGAFTNSGQICSAIKRVYVSRATHAELADALAAEANEVKVGDGADPATQLGPVSNRPQFDRVRSLVDDALAHGAKALAGGAAVDRPGYFFAPTVLVGVEDGMPIVDEEQFGPALPVLSYDTVEEAIARANAGWYGLSGSVWTDDVERGAAVAAQLDCGTAWVNSHLSLAPHQPFGGFKWSGIGVENGPWGLDGFSELQVLHRTLR
ncbi:MAG: aldehyde dehydrogenase family protein [Acidimicrobiales bacterium]